MTWITEYKKSLKMPEVEELIDLFFYRPIAFLLVRMIYNTRITPDNLTTAAIMAGISAGICYAFGLPVTGKIGAVLIILFVVLDCSDGQLARLKKNGTAAGRLLDGIADYIVTISIYTGIAIGYSQVDGEPRGMIILLILSGISIIIQDVLVDFYRTKFLDIVLKRKNTFSEGINEYRDEFSKLKEQRGNWFKKSIIFIYLIYSGIQSKITTGRTSKEPVNILPDDYYRKNRLLIRFWVFIGPSAMRSSLVICTLAGRFDIYFWITIGAFNFIALVLWVIQSQVDNSYLQSGTKH